MKIRYIATTDLKPHPDTELVPPMRPDEWKDFIQDVAIRGIKVPLEVAADGTILDGHHRFKAAKELAIPQLPVIDAVLGQDTSTVYMLKAAVLRRHLTDSQRRMMAAMWSSDHKQTKDIETGKFLQSPSAPHYADGSDVSPTRQEATGLFQVSRAGHDKAKYVLNRDADLAEKVHKGDMNLNEAYRQVKGSEIHKNEVMNLPNGLFSVIYADPPWPYDFDLSARGDPNIHYPTMTLDQIKSLQIPIEENAILFLWTPNPKLKEALEVLSAWGFEYKTNFVWVKDKIGLGYYVRSQHELCLLGKRGVMPTPEVQNRPPSVVQAPRTEHSHKPDKFYQIIESMYPNFARLELFARNKREGWESWGNELESDKSKQ